MCAIGDISLKEFLRHAVLNTWFTCNYDRNVVRAPYYFVYPFWDYSLADPSNAQYMAVRVIRSSSGCLFTIILIAHYDFHAYSPSFEHCALLSDNDRDCFDKALVRGKTYGLQGFH